MAAVMLDPVSGELFVWPPAPSGCCIPGVCAATGEATKSSVTVKASIFIACSIRYLTTDTANQMGTHPREEGCRIAINIAKLAELVRK
jgi:hypothetical protein